MVAGSIRHVLDEFLDCATEIGAQLVEYVRLDIRPVVIDQLGERHAVQSRGCRNLLQLDALPLTELEIRDTFPELES